MSYNGSGVFNINSSGQPVVSNTLIQASVFNAFASDIATGLSNCITKDGQQTVTANIPMAGFKFTGLGLGVSSTDAARVDNANAYKTCEFRLTLTTGTPVTTADVTAATTVYASPYCGKNIALYDGTNWHMRNSGEMSISVPNQSSKIYDVFCYDNSGTATLELSAAWASDTSRTDALTTQDGVLVKSGDETRRYLGTFRTTGTSGQTEDSVTKRYVWNYYNRVLRPMRVADTNSYIYTTNTYRQARNTATNQLDLVMGYSEDPVTCEVVTEATNASGIIQFYVSIGLDSTTTAATGVMGGQSTSTTASTYRSIRCWAAIYPDVGRHTLVWLEKSQASGTTTWNGETQSAGIYGTMLG